MAPIPGEPQPGSKPPPIGNNIPLTLLLTTCTLCGLFLLWRRAEAFRRVVSFPLKSMASNEGQIRLSTDDGPPAREFLEDDYDEDNELLEGSDDDEPLSHKMKNATKVRSAPDYADGGESHTRVWEEE